MTEQEIALANAKGLETRRRRWEQRNEKKRLAALAAQEADRAARKADETYMKEAVRQAKKAAAIGDVPIGCVIVKEGQIIARGYNRRNADKTVLSHAEITAIKKACKKEGDWRLEDCTLYVTPGTVSHVCWSDCPGQNPQGSDWLHERKSRLRRFRDESFAGAWVQSSGGHGYRYFKRRMLRTDD